MLNIIDANEEFIFTAAQSSLQNDNNKERKKKTDYSFTFKIFSFAFTQCLEECETTVEKC